MKYKGLLNNLKFELQQIDTANIFNSFYYKKYLKIGTINSYRDLFVYLISNSKQSKINKNYLGVASSLNKLAKYVLKNNDLNILIKLNLQHLDIKSINKRKNLFLFNYARIDSLLSSNGDIKILEFNARRAQMFEDTDWLNYKLAKHFKNANYISINSQIVKNIHSYLKSESKDLNNIILLSDFKKNSKFSFKNELIKQFSNCNITHINYLSIIDFYKKLILKNNGLYYKGKKIDAFILQSLGKGRKSFFTSTGGINNSKIKQAYAKQLIQIASPPSSLIFGRKQSLNLLQIKKIQKILKLNKTEINAVKTLAKNVNTNFTNIKNFKNLVIKITGIGQGSGVFIGNKLTKKSFNILANYYHNNKYKIIVQKKITNKEVQIFFLKSKKFVKAIIQIEPFILPTKNNKFKIIGYSSRAILKKDIKNTEKFNPAFNNKKILFGNVITCK